MFGEEKNIDKYYYRREVVFIILSGMFLGSLAMLNILGLSRQLDLSFSAFGFMIPVKLFVGVLPYPITFLCTDFISELYGKKRAKAVVWVGLLLNMWVLLIVWVGGVLPNVPEMVAETGLPALDDPNRVFYEIRMLTFGAITASMIAYLSAQFIDVQVFHLLKKLTKGKHLWLRNNGSTLVSQLVDSVAVVLITYYYAEAIHVENGEVFETLMIFIYSGYIFKMLSALIDTLPFYLGVKFLSKYLNIQPNKMFEKEENK